MNVYQAAQKRVKYIFQEFEQVLIAFSGGKDSGVCLNLFVEYAKQNNLLHKLGVYHEDYEAGYPHTFEYIERAFEALPKEVRKYWLCLPIKAACSVSMHKPHWIPWDSNKKEIWVRDMPDKDYCYHENNIWFPFTKGTKGFDFRIDFSKEFARKHGKTAVIVGLRMDESLSRRAVITSQHRSEMFKAIRYSKIVTPDVVNFYPIYDWRTEDIWISNARFGWDYNKLYDMYYLAGVSIHEMRTASPFHASGQKSLSLYRAICPHMWGKMVGRANGVNFGAIYGGTHAMGWKKIIKPDHFTWKQYALFLIDTLPPDTRKKVVTHLRRLETTWAEKGYGRNPRVIKQIEEAGIKIENTHEISKLCTKPDKYEVIKIKGEWPDEINIKGGTPFRHCPNWKAVCITIMKNDFTLTYMGLGRTKEQNQLRKAAIEKYQKIL